MEIDQLKQFWKDEGKSSWPINDVDLKYMLSQRSRSHIAKMKRNLKWEVFFLILSYGIIISTTSISRNTYFIFYDGLLIIIAILFMIYAKYKYKVLRSMECISCEVKTNLNLQINSLEKLVKLYFSAGNIGMPLAYFLAGVISYINTQKETVSFPEAITIIIFLVIGFVLALIGYYINRWYLFQLYGKHIQKLKNILYEMDESNSI